MLQYKTVLLAGICCLSTVFGFVRNVLFSSVLVGFIVFNCGDSVIAVEPFTEVYQFASVAAERIKLPFPTILPGRFIDNLLTYRTSAFHIAI
jgi:hypothetical protein